jgi:hypothetical protein
MSDAGLAALTRRRDELARALAREQAALEALERSRPRTEAVALEALSELAPRMGVLVRESAPLPQASRQAPEHDTRARRRIVAVTTFGGLRSFLGALASLPVGSISVEALSLETTTLPASDTTGAPEGLRVLVATFVVVL